MPKLFGVLRTACVAVVLMQPALAQDATETIRPAKVFTATQTASEIGRTYPGIVLPSREVELSFRVSGRVMELPIRAAMDIGEGDMVAALDPRDFERQIAQLESQRDQAIAQLAALRAGARAEEIIALEAAVRAAEAQVDQTRDQAERTRTLVERGVTAAARQKQDDAALRVAEANLETAIEQLEIGRAGGRAEDIEASEAALRGLEAQLQVARDNLEDATLLAPFEGVVARRDIDNFVNIQAGQSVALLQSIAILHVAFDIPGTDITALTINGVEQVRFAVTFDAAPDQVFAAEVVEFSLQADAATQTFRGRVAVTQPEDFVLLPGMVARVRATTDAPTPEIRVPLTAIASAPDGSPQVWLVGDDNSVSAKPVTLGGVTGEMIAIAEGLAPGERVVAAGVGQITDGMTIRPIDRIGG